MAIVSSKTAGVTCVLNWSRGDQRRTRSGHRHLIFWVWAAASLPGTAGLGKFQALTIVNCMPILGIAEQSLSNAPWQCAILVWLSYNETCASVTSRYSCDALFSGQPRADPGGMNLPTWRWLSSRYTVCMSLRQRREWFYPFSVVLCAPCDNICYMKPDVQRGC